eukprot:TRINITY_DN7315_c0_g1_i1.p1 TRINITY_DN7315_c0_g1~~TRINITY_DN7315_c0_g1_i1.p1  ORF type:complete len:541 (+),score=40.99 TRINITY_DN7315_c0_g1_i1:44-1666(+)
MSSPTFFGRAASPTTHLRAASPTRVRATALLAVHGSSRVAASPAAAARRSPPRSPSGPGPAVHVWAARQSAGLHFQASRTPASLQVLPHLRTSSSLLPIPAPPLSPRAAPTQPPATVAPLSPSARALTPPPPLPPGTYARVLRPPSPAPSRPAPTYPPAPTSAPASPRRSVRALPVGAIVSAATPGAAHRTGSGWELPAGEMAVVVGCDDGGAECRLRLRNSSGLTSEWLYREHYREVPPELARNGLGTVVSDPARPLRESQPPETVPPPPPPRSVAGAGAAGARSSSVPPPLMSPTRRGAASIPDPPLPPDTSPARRPSSAPNSVPPAPRACAAPLGTPSSPLQSPAWAVERDHRIGTLVSETDQRAAELSALAARAESLQRQARSLSVPIISSPTRGQHGPSPVRFAPLRRSSSPTDRTSSPLRLRRSASPSGHSVSPFGAGPARRASSTRNRASPPRGRTSPARGRSPTPGGPVRPPPPSPVVPAAGTGSNNIESWVRRTMSQGAAAGRRRQTSVRAAPGLPEPGRGPGGPRGATVT